MSKIKCLVCNKILKSKFRHDFQSCNCPNQTFIDGGSDYLRIGGIDMCKIEILKDDNGNSDLVKPNDPSDWNGTV